MTPPLVPDTEVAALVGRVEAATQPDRRIDAEIASLAGLRIVEEGHPLGRCCYDSDGRLIVLPRYTASLDAAMALVPTGFMWRLQSWPDGVNSALLEKNAGDFGAIDARHTETLAATPALALCAAALRAALHERKSA